MVNTVKLKKLPKKIFFPINISVIASLGVHALFFSFVLPKWDLNNSEGNSQSLSNTPVIELNQIEKTRLPDLSPRQFSNWELISKLPSTNTQISEIPTPNPRSFQFPSLNNNNLLNLPAPPSVSPLPNYSYNIPSSFKLPPPPPLDSITPNIPTTIPPQIERDINDFVISQQQQQINIRESLFPPLPNGDIESPRVLINSPNDNLKNPPIASNPPELNNNNNPPNQDDVAIKSPSIKEPNYRVLTSRLQQDVTNTSNEDATKNDLAWRQEINVAQPKAINMIGIYPKDACIRKLEGNAAYGVTVNGQGKVTNTKLLKSAGLPIFNQQALQQIKGKSFASTGKAQAYHVFVNFKPNNCPSLSLDNLGKIPPKNQPSPSPVVEESPKPTQNQQPSNTPLPEKKPAPVAPNNTQTQTTKPQPANTPLPEEKPAPVAPNNTQTQTTKPQPSNTPLPEEKPAPVTPNNTQTQTTKPKVPNTPLPEKKPVEVKPNNTQTQTAKPQPVNTPLPEKKPVEVKPNNTQTQTTKP